MHFFKYLFLGWTVYKLIIARLSPLLFRNHDREQMWVENNIHQEGTINRLHYKTGRKRFFHVCMVWSVQETYRMFQLLSNKI